MATLMSKTELLTPRQREIFEVIKDNIMNRGYGPTVREIGDATGIKSPNGVMCHLHALVKKGMIQREANLSRAIQLVDKAERKTALQYRGQFSQGGKLKAVTNGEQIDFLDILGSGDRFCFRASDESLAEDGIEKGDYLICRKQQFYRDGDRVIVQVDGKQTMLKRLFDEGDGFRLESTTTSKNAIRVTDVSVLGMLVGVIRKL